MAQVILVVAGGVRATLDQHDAHRPAPAALAIPAGAVHGFRFDPATEGFVVSLADGQLDSSPMGSWIRTVLFEQGAFVALEAADASRLAVLARQLLDEHDGDAIGADVVVGSLLQALLMVLARAAEAASDQGREPRPPDLYREFRDAVERHFHEHWPVARYAAALGVSESTLNRACHRVAAATAFEVTQERLELEARRRLRFTGTAVQQIATDLGFADASYFSRFVRRRTGRSPSAHRNG